MSARDDLRDAQRHAPTRPNFPLTDLGNAERLVHQHGEELRFVPGMGWFAWEGRYWRRDDDGEVLRRAKLMARTILGEAQELEDSDQRKAAVKWALATETEPRLRAAVSLAESELPVIAHAETLDADPFLLAVENGVIDLRTGELGPHEPANLITKIAPAAYDPEARSKDWDGVLEQVTGDNEELRGFLARAVGYTLTGDTTEEVLFFMHGPSATGKTTSAEAYGSVLGSYSTVADFDAFLQRRGDNGVRSDIARLAGARLVLSVEVDDGKRLAEGLIKSLTGGDTVTARFMYREFFEFRPAFKLWLVANARPRVSAEDEAIWRRIIQIPFTQVIPENERDPHLKRRLQTPEARSAILTWAVQGCLEWQKTGLAVPEQVRAYTAEYRAENDYLAEFINDNCQLGSGLKCASGALYEAYKKWCEANGERPVAQRTLAKKLEERDDISKGKRSKNARLWEGITLTEEAVTGDA
jgi:putative DNA primase/helicase